MKKIGLTGIIGSGKTTAALCFKDLGVPVFIADDSAKKLMVEDGFLKKNIKKILGDKAYLGDSLNKNYIFKKIFHDTTLLKQMNRLIHPMVKADFESWILNQNHSYVVYEAALIFENKSESFFDKIICIKTPINIIHERLSKRDNYSKERIDVILDSQLDQKIKCMKSDYCIENISKNELFEQINFIHSEFI